MIVNVSKAKTHLSKLVDMAFQGEEIIIAKDNVPLIELVAHRPKPKRTLGLLAAKIENP